MSPRAVPLEEEQWLFFFLGQRWHPGPEGRFPQGRHRSAWNHDCCYACFHIFFILLSSPFYNPIMVGPRATQIVRGRDCQDGWDVARDPEKVVLGCAREPPDDDMPRIFGAMGAAIEASLEASFRLVWRLMRGRAWMPWRERFDDPLQRWDENWPRYWEPGVLHQLPMHGSFVRVPETPRLR